MNEALCPSVPSVIADKGTVSRWEPYPKYKDSGIEWLGEVPEGWAIRFIKRIAGHNNEVLSETTDPGYEIEYVDISSVDEEVGITMMEVFRFEDAPSRARRRVREGDVIVSTVRTYLRAIASIHSPPSNLVVSTGFCVIRPHNEFDTGFARYLFKATYLIDEIVARSVGVSYPAINATELVAIKVALPPLLEQRAIAAFLDRETTKIDTLISKKERLLELLQEKRAALISHAVTKGLNPDAKMKDSGIEWLGEIPEHWEVWKITHGFRIIGSGTTPKSDDLAYYGGDILWVTTSELRETIIKDTNQKLTQLALQDYSTLKRYPRGALLIAMYGATIGRLGILGIPAVVNQACCAFSEPTAFDTKFLFYWLVYRRPILISLSTGGGQPNLNQEDLKVLRVPTPPVNEQRVIAAFLDRETGRIDALINKVHKSIELLREYRAALISAAVTGKIDVRREAGA